MRRDREERGEKKRERDIDTSLYTSVKQIKEREREITNATLEISSDTGKKRAITGFRRDKRERYIYIYIVSEREREREREQEKKKQEDN